MSATTSTRQVLLSVDPTTARTSDGLEPALPDVPTRSCAIAFMRAPPESTAQLVDLVRAAHYDLATRRITVAQHEDVMGYVHELLASRRATTGARGPR